MISTFFEPISIDYRHIYRSSIPFLPRHSRLAQIYGHLADEIKVVFRDQDQDITVNSRLWAVKFGDFIACLTFSPDNQLIAVGFEDGRIEVLEVRSGKRLSSLKRHKKGIRDILFFSDSERIASISAGKVTVEGLDKNHYAIQTGDPSGFIAIVGNVLAYTNILKGQFSNDCIARVLHVWDTATSKLVVALHAGGHIHNSMMKMSFGLEVSCVDECEYLDLAFTPDGVHLLEARSLPITDIVSETLFLIWDWKQSTLLTVLRSADNYRRLDFFPSGHLRSILALWIRPSTNVQALAFVIPPHPARGPLPIHEQTGPIKPASELSDFLSEIVPGTFEDVRVETIRQSVSGRNGTTYYLQGNKLCKYSSHHNSNSLRSTCHINRQWTAYGYDLGTLEVCTDHISDPHTIHASAHISTISSNGTLIAVAYDTHVIINEVKSATPSWKPQALQRCSWLLFIANNTRIICEDNIGVVRVFDEIQIIWELDMSIHDISPEDYARAIWGVQSPDGSHVVRASAVINHRAWSNEQDCNTVTLFDTTSDIPFFSILQDSSPFFTH